jgi:hypothetical protein
MDFLVLGTFLFRRSFTHEGGIGFGVTRIRIVEVHGSGYLEFHGLGSRNLFCFSFFIFLISALGTDFKA